MNIPNKLTLSRIIMAGVLVLLLTSPFRFSYTLALVVFGLAALTDLLDGHLARNVYGITDFGKLMDPLADKIMISAVFICFVGLRLPSQPSGLVPAWMVVLILSREFLVTGLRLLAAGKGQVLSAGNWGKHKTTWQIIVIIAIMLALALRFDFLPAEADYIETFDRYFDLGAYIATLAVAVLTLLSGLVYFRKHIDLIADD
jgi:CDP-diacylglycerol---glycerol-3-phosphate 3-phosphatidyltransferase